MALLFTLNFPDFYSSINSLRSHKSHTCFKNYLLWGLIEPEGMNKFKVFLIIERNYSIFMQENQASLVYSRRIIKSEANIGMYFKYIKLLVVEFSLNGPLLGIILSPNMNFRPINCNYLSIIDSREFNSSAHIFTRIMNHGVHLKTLEAIFNDVSWPKFKGLNFDIFVRINVSQWFKRNKVFAIRGKCKALNFSIW